MKHSCKLLSAAALTALLTFPATEALAGNPSRAGSAGATELLINPWARSSGWAGCNIAGVKGLEAMYGNVAGTAFTKKTEVLFCRTQWLKGTDININSFGLTQRVGETGAVGLSIMAMDFGDIAITTTESPEGNLGTFSPQFINIGLSYAKGFSDNIYGGLTVRGITEKISNVSSRGIALDAGIQYIAGRHDQLKFGISLKNIGPRMNFSGDGLSFKAPVPGATNGANTYSVQQRTQNFELPSLLNIGAGYDFYLKKDSSSMKNHRITAMGTFTSQSFDKDQYKVGVEYGFKNMLMVRVGYTYEKDILDKEKRTTVFTGPSAGFTLELPFGKNKSTFGIDYSYRATNPFNGTHSIGARINL
ncbi:MAG: PorV/PorQ family protein [Bacteroidetes bacterium]|nr:PorV/PorQ family protein [Bacteroidota bacterium]